MLDFELDHNSNGITSKLSERSIEFADLITERGKILNPEYSICRDQPTTGASPLRINDLLSRRFCVGSPRRKRNEFAIGFLLIASSFFCYSFDVELKFCS